MSSLKATRLVRLRRPPPRARRPGPTARRASSSLPRGPAAAAAAAGAVPPSPPSAASFGAPSSSGTASPPNDRGGGCPIRAPSAAPSSSSSSPSSSPPFRKILVANRGEIALRVIRTARSLGVETVAIYSTADARSPHVIAADEAVCVGPPASSSSYLDVDKVCEAIELTGAEAVHPGYGFLSENAAFAERVARTTTTTANGKGVAKFVGPSSSAIEALGDKIRSKLVADAAGVSTIPGYNGVVEGPEHALEIAKEIGYPVMIKASSGGGGKGMRICRRDEQPLFVGFSRGLGSAHEATTAPKSPNEVHRMLALQRRNPSFTSRQAGSTLECAPFAPAQGKMHPASIFFIEPFVLLGQRRGKGTPENSSGIHGSFPSSTQVIEGYRLGSAEAKSFFGDDRLLVEKYVEDPHHIEIQVLSGKDPATGELDILCFPERECSIQRRNQKVIEESPSPHLLPSTRREMIRQVKSLVREVGYESAGTVEFLVDKHQNFYFLEMNTRLQVEHPVTEMISGDGHHTGNCVDLVRGMLEVAAGRGIPKEYLAMVDRSDGGEEAKDGGEGANVRYRGHAIEARIYAEDPLRGFLPSTGPLVKYVEPPSLLRAGGDEGGEPCHVRVDAGVVPGWNVAPHYDPILSKVVCYSPTSRGHAIEGLGEALDRYLLRGVRHNVPFARDVLRVDEFVEGHTPTSFIDEHYPEGFSGGRLSDGERAELAAIAREVGRRRDEATGAPSRSTTAGEEVVVCLGGMFGDAYRVSSRAGEGGDVVCTVVKLSKEEDGEDIAVSGEVHTVKLSEMEYEPSSDLALVKVAGEGRALQVHGNDDVGTIGLTMYGLDTEALIMSPDEYSLARRMKEPREADLGNFVLSPMPGTLISFAVKEGDVVEMGQELCVVEAMKMQNVIRSHRAGAKVGRLCGEVGGSLKADEVLLEFEGSEEEVAAV
ncbi:hypothetical protein ACHAWF_011724 [Thalassiosira exigua]